MNKFKELWGKNKVLIVLGLILIVCAITIVIVTISFFFGGKDDRVLKTGDVKISESVKEDYIASLEEEKAVEKATVSVSISGVVYIHIYFKADTALVDAQSIASNSLAKFSEDILNVYDFNIEIKCEKSEGSDGFSLIGARNVASKTLEWDNNTPVESEE